MFVSSNSKGTECQNVRVESGSAKNLITCMHQLTRMKVSKALLKYMHELPPRNDAHDRDKIA